MRSYPYSAATAATTLATGVSIAGALALVGCSSGLNAPSASSSSQVSSAPTSSERETTGTPAPPPVIELSPAGVTTAVGAPAESTEEEYFQACHVARLWMATRPGDPHQQIEPYLALVQAAVNPGPGTFNSPWSQLAPERQSAVIVAVKAAADSDCG
jgi:hypothetical protein